jgi:acetoin utilization protein AcuB
MEIKDIIHGYGGRIVSLLTSHENVPPGYRNVYMRVYQIDRGMLPQIQTELKEKAYLLYMMDHRIGGQGKPPQDIQNAMDQLSIN